MELVVHRGTNTNSPENSIEGIKEIRGLTEDAIIELDVVPTKDNKLTLFHDLSLNKVCGIDKLVYDFTLEELNCIQSQHQFVDLQKLLNMFPKQKFLLDFRCSYHSDYFVQSNIDFEAMKENLVEKYLGSLRSLNKENLILMCSDISRAEELQRLGFEVDLSENCLRDHLELIERKREVDFLNYRLKRVYIQNRLLSKNLVDVFHEYKIQVFSTPSMPRSIENSKTMLQKALALNCDGIWLSPINSDIINVIKGKSE